MTTPFCLPVTCNMQEITPSHLSLFTNTTLSGLKAWTSYNCHPLHIHGIHLLLMPSVLCPGLIMIYRAIQLLLALSTAPSIIAEVWAESQLWGHIISKCLVRNHWSPEANFRASTTSDVVITPYSIVEDSFSHISYHYHAPKLHLLQINLVGSGL